VINFTEQKVSPFMTKGCLTIFRFKNQIKAILLILIKVNKETWISA
jgi:hypothetical protein